MQFDGYGDIDNMTETPEIITPRLILKPLRSEDALQIQHVFPRWEIVRYLIASVP